MDELHELTPPVRELLDGSFTSFDSMYDIPPRFFSSLAPHRSCICEGWYRIRDGLQQAFPELDGQSLIYFPGSIEMQRTGTGLPDGARPVRVQPVDRGVPARSRRARTRG